MAELLNLSHIIGPQFEGLAMPSFWLPLNDLGNGEVNLVPLRAGGSPTPTFTRATTAWTKETSSLSLPGVVDNYASMPDSAANSIVGDIDIRVRVALNDWTPLNFTPLFAKWGSGTAYAFAVQANGIIDFQSQDQIGSTVPVGAADGSTKWVRVTQDVDNGASGHDTKFYTSDNGIVWSQLGSTQTLAGVISIDDTARPVYIGAIENAVTGVPERFLLGKVYYAELRNGIDGPIVAKFDPSETTSGATSFVSSTGETWTINQSGSPKAEIGQWWREVASGVPRSCYLGFNNTAVGAYGGYLAEDARTNLALWSRDMTNAAWVKINVTAAKNATGIDGVANSASTLTATANGGTALQTLTAAASSRTYSVWLRRKTGTGTVTIQQTGTTLDVTASLNSLTYTRVELNASILNSVFGIIFGTSGDAVEIDFNQFEAGTFAASPIPTTTVAVARNADVLTYPYAGNALTSAGAASADLFLNNTSTGAIQTAIALSTTTGPLNIASAGAATTIRISDGTTDTAKSSLTDMTTAVRKRASSWGGSVQAITGDDVAVTSGAFDGTLGSTAIGIGCATDGTLFWFGTVKNVRIWTKQLSDNTLRGLTS